MFFKSFDKSLLVTIVCSLLIVQILLTPKLCINSALLGVNLFVNKVFPSLFPFLIITSIMMAYDGIQIYSNILGNIICKPLRLPLQCTFVLMVSFFCGYPLGAKYACDLYEKGHINFITCERLINIASNASPLFVIGAVGTSMLRNNNIGYLLLISNYISCFVMGLILPGKGTYNANNRKMIGISSKKNIGIIIKDSIEGSIKTSMSIGGFVILFSVIIGIIKSNILFDIAVNNISTLLNLNKNIIEGMLLGIIEMTNGSFLISSADISMSIKATLISFILGFSGFSVISQVFSFTYKHNLPIKKYIARKAVQGLICSLVTTILYKLIYSSKTVVVFATNSKRISNFAIIFLLICMLIIPFILNKINRLFHAS
jgi:sporulation integral membrane protein YlbJ